MRRYRAPYGDGFYEIGKVNGKWFAVIYYDATDAEGYTIVETDYNELCERLANIYM